MNWLLHTLFALVVISAFGSRPGGAESEWLEVADLHSGDNVTGIVSFASKDNLVHIDAAVLLGLSLHRHVPEAPRFLLVAEGMERVHRKQLERAHWHLVKVPEWHANEEESFMKGYFYNTYNKVSVFRVHWPQLLFLDADTYVLDNQLRELLYYHKLPPGHIGMVRDCCNDTFEGGMFLFRPSLSMYDKLRKRMENRTGWDALADEAITKEYAGRIESLEPQWNVHGNTTEHCQKAVIVHFTGAGKPTTPDPDNLRSIREGKGAAFVNNLRCPEILQDYYRRLEDSRHHLTAELQWALKLVTKRELYSWNETRRRMQDQADAGFIDEAKFQDFANTNIGIVTHAGKGREEYVDMAVVLGQSLLDHVPAFPRLCLVREDTPYTDRRRLTEAGWVVVPTGAGVEHDDSLDVDLHDQAHLFRIKMNRLVYIEPTVIVLNRTFQILMRTSRVRTGHIALGPGLTFLQPDLETYRALMTEHPSTSLSEHFKGRAHLGSDFVEGEWRMPRAAEECSKVAFANFNGSAYPTLPDPDVLADLREGMADPQPLGMPCQSIQSIYLDALESSSPFLSSKLREALKEIDGILPWLPSRQSHRMLAHRMLAWGSPMNKQAEPASREAHASIGRRLTWSLSALVPAAAAGHWLWRRWERPRSSSSSAGASEELSAVTA